MELHAAVLEPPKAVRHLLRPPSFITNCALLDSKFPRMIMTDIAIEALNEQGDGDGLRSELGLE